jgi:hypothetical protein
MFHENVKSVNFWNVVFDTSLLCQSFSDEDNSTVLLQLPSEDPGLSNKY